KKRFITATLSPRALRAMPTANAYTNAPIPTRKARSEIAIAGSSNASTPNTTGSAVTANTAFAIHAATTSRRPGPSGRRAIAGPSRSRRRERAQRVELAARDRRQMLDESVVRQRVLCPPPRGRTHRGPPALVGQELAQRGTDPTDGPPVDDEPGH